MDGIKRSRKLLWPKFATVLAAGMASVLGLFLFEYLVIRFGDLSGMDSISLIVIGFLSIHLVAFIVPMIVLAREFPVQLHLSITRKTFIRTFLEAVVLMGLIVSLLLNMLAIIWASRIPSLAGMVEWRAIILGVFIRFLQYISFGLLGTFSYLFFQKYRWKSLLIGLGAIAGIIGLRIISPLNQVFGILKETINVLFGAQAPGAVHWPATGWLVLFQVILVGLILSLGRHYQPKAGFRG